MSNVYQSYYIIPHVGAVEALEMELNTMQQRSELQEAQLKVLREQKLAEVQKAM